MMANSPGEVSQPVGVYLHDHLPSAQEGVSDELACAQCYWLLSVRHVYDL